MSMESREDILREIISYPVTRFWPDMNPGFIWASAHNYTAGIPAEEAGGMDEMLVQAACQEECDARGWLWRIETIFEDGHAAYIWADMHDNPIGMAEGQPSASIAIATALRDALRTL